MQPGEFHVVVNVLSVDRQGNILITKRHPKKPFGGKWEVTGGSVLAGETSLHGAVRELEEETGLHAAESERIIVEPLSSRHRAVCMIGTVTRPTLRRRIFGCNVGKPLHFKLFPRSGLHR